MTDPTIVTQEEMALRRRARRRLVGAVAIALTAVLVLPMVFDPEPKPLGPEVELRIPAKESPFEAAPAAAPPAQEAGPAPQTAEPTLPPAAEQPALAPKPVPGKNVELPPEKPQDKEVAQAVPKADKHETQEPPKKPVETPKPEPKPEAKAATRTEAAPAGKSYVLQLGAFGSEINAKQLAEKVQSAGFKAQVSSAGGQFRVRVGPVADHEKALDYQVQLKAKGFNPVLLGI